MVRTSKYYALRKYLDRLKDLDDDPYRYADIAEAIHHKGGWWAFTLTPVSKLIVNQLQDSYEL